MIACFILLYYHYPAHLKSTVCSSEDFLPFCEQFSYISVSHMCAKALHYISL